MESAKITLTQEKLKSIIHYDPEQGIFTKDGNVIGSFSDSYTRIMILGHRYKAGRLAWFYMTGEWPDQIDHINGRKGDDRFSNLRNVNQSQNSMNRASYGQYSKGVSYDARKLKNPYQARITSNGQTINLGQYATEQEAADAYINACIKYHGEHANVR